MATMTQRPPVPDYYDVLGTKPGATGIEIQRCFRKIQRIWRGRAKSGMGGLIMAAVCFLFRFHSCLCCD